MNDNTKVIQEIHPHNINLSGVGKLKKSLVVSSMKNGVGSIYPEQVSSKNRGNNLKAGGREKLERNQLTSYAKRQIRGAGSMQKWLVENDLNVYSTLMTTLTYGKAVPDHKTAKKHLNTFLTRCRQQKFLKHYVWVAQLQTGKRAKAKGLKSYRAENGSAIHFHILHLTYKGSKLQLENSQKEFRKIWKSIVNKWEAKSGYNIQNISGVNVIPVYNASNYVSAYISNENETIIGNMWNMSSEMRKEIEKTKIQIDVDQKAYNTMVRLVSEKRLYQTITDKQGNIKREKIRDVSFHTISFKMWNDDQIIITDNTKAVIENIERIHRNNVKTNQCNEPNVIDNSPPRIKSDYAKKYIEHKNKTNQQCNAPNVIQSSPQRTSNINTAQTSVDNEHFIPVKEPHKRQSKRPPQRATQTTIQV